MADYGIHPRNVNYLKNRRAVIKELMEGRVNLTGTGHHSVDELNFFPASVYRSFYGLASMLLPVYQGRRCHPPQSINSSMALGAGNNLLKLIAAQCIVFSDTPQTSNIVPKLLISVIVF